MVNRKLLQNALFSQYGRNQGSYIHYQLQFLIVRKKKKGLQLHSLFSTVSSQIVAFSFFIPLGVNLCLFQQRDVLLFLFIYIYIFLLSAGQHSILYTMTTGTLLLLDGQCQSYTCAVLSHVLLLNRLHENPQTQTPKGSSKENDKGFYLAGGSCLRLRC